MFVNVIQDMEDINVSFLIVLDYYPIPLLFVLIMEIALHRMFVNVKQVTLVSNANIHHVMAFSQIFQMSVQDKAIVSNLMSASVIQDMEGINVSSHIVLGCYPIRLQFVLEMELA